MKRLYVLGAALTSVLLLSTSLRADSLTLTAAGVADGFTLSTFVTTNPGNVGCCSGPFGVAMLPNGNVIVATGSGTLDTFTDTDNQTLANAVTSSTGNSGTSAFATAGGQAYGWENGQLVQFNSSGGIDHVLTGVTLNQYLGMWGDPVNGHIIATTQQGLANIDPLANGGLGSFTILNAGVFGDGVSVSPDGTTAYVEQGCINGYSTTTGAATGFSACGFNSPDGTGVISGGKFSGDLIVNNNNGEVDLYDISTNTITAIATGGSRGDYTSPDTSNGSLFLDSADSVHRLSCGPGCSIGSTGNSVPEPSSFAGLFGLGLAGLTALRRRRIS